MNKTLQHQLQAFEKQTGGTLGLSALHLQDQMAVNYKEEELFLLCSTYKLPLAVDLLQKVELGTFNLEDPIPISKYDLRPGNSSFINELDFSTNVELSLLNLLTIMMQYSCNTATDRIFKLVGGPSAVTTMLNKAGIEHLKVDRITYEILADLEGVLHSNLQELTLPEYVALEKKLSAEEKKLARQNFFKNTKDHGSPKSMTQLLQKIYSNEILGKSYAELLLKIMQHCKTGPNRMVAMLPPGTLVSRKTGTANGYVTETAIIQLPMDLGSFAISIFLKNTPKSLAESEQLFAHIGRMLYDYFLFKNKKL